MDASAGRLAESFCDVTLASALQKCRQKGINEDGKVLQTLQDASGNYALTTGLIEYNDGTLFVTSLTEQDLGIIEP